MNTDNNRTNPSSKHLPNKTLYKVIHVIGGGEFGGAEQHILQLFSQFPEQSVEGKVVCFYEAELSRALREMGVSVTVLNYGRFDFRLLGGLRRLFEQEQPDVIHTHGVKANFFVRLAARKIPVIPLITTVHSMLKYDYATRMAYYFVSLMERSTRMWNDHYIAVSTALQQSLIEEEHIPIELATVVHHGINTEQFHPRDRGVAVDKDLRHEWGVPHKAYVIGMVGRLVPIKGIDYLIRALPPLIAVTRTNIHLVIVGSGPMEDELRMLAKELKIAERVHFTGFRKDIADCMRAFDCFVGASITEGLGLNVLEAMATELPVVVTGVGGIMDFAVDQHNALLVQPKSSQDLTDKLQVMITSPELARKLAVQAREHVAEHFSLQRMAEQTIRLYERLLRVRRSWTAPHQSRLSKKIVLSGYYGSGNSGDEAVLQSILQAFYEEAEKQQTTISPVVLSINPKITEQLHGVRAIHRMRLLQIIRTIRKSDGVISGGGSLLQDMTGRMTIPYYLGIVKIAQWLKKPTFIYSQGVGPIRIKLYYPFIRHIYNRCAYITLRDGESKTFLQSIGVKHPHMEVVSDPVVGLVTEQVPPGFVNRQIALSEAQDEQNTPIIGVSVRFWRQDRDDLHQIAHALRLIVEQSHVQLRFLPFQMPADLKASQYVIDLLGETYRNRITLLTDAIHPQDMLSEVGQCDLVIGVRLHSLIYAANYAIPMVGISYDPKIDQFLHQLQMTATAQTDHIDPHKVAEEAIQLLENKQTWIDHKKPLIEQMKKKSHLPAQQITSILRNKG